MGLSEGLAVSATVVARVTDSGVEHRAPRPDKKRRRLARHQAILGHLIERSEPIGLLLDRVLNSLSLKD